MGNIKVLFNKYLFSGLLFLLSLLVVLYGIVMFQNGGFIAAGLLILVVAFVSFLYTAGIITKKAQSILLIIFAVLACGLVYGNYRSIKSAIEFTEEKEEKEAQVKQRMIDIRTAQLAYRTLNGMYTDNFDTLKYFIATAKLMGVKRTGSMEDSAAVADGRARIDTLYYSVLDSLFLSESALTKRKYPFFLDSVAIAPNEGGAEFIMKVGQLTKAGGLKVPTFSVIDPQPFDPRPDTLRLGSLSEASTNGNWKE